MLAASAGVYLHASIVVLPAMDALKSARPFCARAAAIIGPEGRIRSYRFWKWRAGYTNYLERPIEDVPDRESLAALWSGSEPFYLIVENLVLEDARAVIGDREPLLRRRVGGSEAYLFSNAAAGGGTGAEDSPGTGAGR